MTDTPIPAPQPNPAPAPTPAPAPAPVPVKPWYDGVLDTESVGWLQNRGLSDKPVNDVALSAIKAAREAQGYVGVPVDRLLKLPADANDQAAWQQVWSKLGAPEMAKGYSFDGIKYGDGEDLEPGLKDALAAAFADSHIPVGSASRITSSLIKFMDGISKNDAEQNAANLAVERDALQKNWGPALEANKFIAKQAALKLGLTPEQVDGLENVVGYSKTMDIFRQIGELMGEGRYVAGEGDTKGRVMTVEQASSKKSDLMKDPAWVKRYNSGGQTEFREMYALNTLIAASLQ